MADSSDNGKSAVEVELEQLRAKVQENEKQRLLFEKAEQEKNLQSAKKDRDADLVIALGKTTLDPKLRDALARAARTDLSYDGDKFVAPGGASVEEFVASQLRTGGEWAHLLNTRVGAAAGGDRGVEIDSIKPGADNSAARAKIAQLVKDMQKS